MKRTSILFVFLIFSVMSIFAQGNGTIVSSDEANNLLGAPTTTIRVYSTVVSSLLDSHDYIMIKVSGDKVNVLGKNRSPVIQQFNLENDDVYFVFDSQSLKEFLDIGNENESYFELRLGGNSIVNKNGDKITDEDGEMVTVTNGEVTIFPAFKCPPFCLTE